MEDAQLPYSRFWGTFTYQPGQPEKRNGARNMDAISLAKCNMFLVRDINRVGFLEENLGDGICDYDNLPDIERRRRFRSIPT